MVSFLAYFNTKERWISVVENIYFGIILGNSICVISILTVSFIILSLTRLKNCCNKNSIFPKELQKEESKLSNLNLHNFTNFRVSNVARSPITQREPQSDITFGEESKQINSSALKQLRTPTEAELYWQRYNPIDGGRVKH